MTVEEAVVRRLVEARPPSLKAALMQPDTGIMAEFKHRSPPSGWINEDTDRLAEVREAVNKECGQRRERARQGT